MIAHGNQHSLQHKNNLSRCTRALEDIVRQKRFSEELIMLMVHVTWISHGSIFASLLIVPLKRDVNTMKANKKGCNPAIPQSISILSIPQILLITIILNITQFHSKPFSQMCIFWEEWSNRHSRRIIIAINSIWERFFQNNSINRETTVFYLPSRFIDILSSDTLVRVRLHKPTLTQAP